MSATTLKFLVGAGPEGVGITNPGETTTDPNPEGPDTPEGGGTGAEAPKEPEKIDGPKLNKFGYPDGVPLTEMSVDQQAAYWKHKARKHEDRANSSVSPEDAQALRERIAELENATLSAEQVAANQQIEQARAEAAAAARAELMPIIHESQLIGYGSTVISGERLQAWVASANPAHFLGEDGAIDGEKVRTTLTSLFGDAKDAAPATPKQRYPNYGQSAPIGGGAKPALGTAGREEAKKRFATAA